MDISTGHAEVNQHEREVSYYKDGYCVATLNLLNDNTEWFEEISEDDKDEYYETMMFEAEKYMNEYNLN